MSDFGLCSSVVLFGTLNNEEDHFGPDATPFGFYYLT